MEEKLDISSYEFKYIKKLIFDIVLRMITITI